MAANSIFFFCSLCVFFALVITKNFCILASCSTTKGQLQRWRYQFDRIHPKQLPRNLCFASLARYALAVQQNPVRLARIAAMVTFLQIHSATSHVSAYLHGSSTEREAAALKDCVDSLGNAADQTRRSATEIGKLNHEAAVGPEVAWRVSNAQAWMSAALTNEETCTDGFDRVDQDPVKADVFSRVRRAKQYTSNTLALVNCLVNGR